MDLEGESYRPVEEREENLKETTHLEEIKVENNGSCSNEIGDLSSDKYVESQISAETDGKEIGTEQPVAMPPKTNESPSGVSGASPPAKGYGLKKWRRIRRDFAKEGGSNVDFNKILKRGLSSAAEPIKPRDPNVEIKQKSEGSVASVNSLVKSPSVPVGTAIKSSSSDSRLAVSNFPVGTDSENSEDQSSKSSTAASSPNLRNDIPVVLGSAWNRNRVKNTSGKSSGNAIPRAQQGKGRIETSKKLRGESIKIEKENSYSSMESDSRSSNNVFTQGSFSILSNGRQSARTTNYDGENSDEAQVSEAQSSEEIQNGSRKENGEVEDASLDDVAADMSWEFKEEESENRQPPTDRDALTESVLLLQAVQEALEKEVQKFGDIGKEPISLPEGSIRGVSLPAEFASIDRKIHEPYSSCQLHFEDTGHSGSLSMEAQLINLNQKANFLESKLQEAIAMFKVKESRVIELEAILNSSKSPKEESGSTLESLQETRREMEMEIEGLFKQRIEAEVEYMVMTTTHELKVVSEGQFVFLNEQKSLAGDKKQMLHKLRDAESKAVVLKRQAEELEASCGGFLGAEEVLKMQSRVCKFTLCFFVQLMLLFVVFGLFILQVLPHSTGVVPT